MAPAATDREPPTFSRRELATFAAVADVLFLALEGDDALALRGG